MPDGWKRQHLRDVINAMEAGVSVNGDDKPALNGEKGVLRVSAVSYGVFAPGANKRIFQADLNRARINPRAGSIIVSRANTSELVGASAYIEQDYENLFLPDKLWQIRKEGVNADTKWLSFFLASSRTREVISGRATGTSSGMKNVSQDAFLGVPILLPPLPEQRRIAAILSQWDDSLSILSRLIEAKRQQKRGLAEALLTGKRRLPGFEGEWELQPLSKFLRESRVPGSNGTTARKLTVKLWGKGVYEKREKLLGSENTKYFKRRAGQLIFSKLDFLNGAFGVVPKDLDGLESTLDLPCFDFLPGLEPQFLLEYISREEFYRQFEGGAIGGRKARRVMPEEFLKAEVELPPLPEQQAIASVLSTLDEELSALERLRTSVQEQKRGLMDLLLTGRVRVKVEEAS
ncbi:restriction endonuclease subunit S [Deinococcus sp. YIM 134068]|uniref:restriction endonuclease subunit S n=1 Tax=Deinococcus lichenicola TaxID=3118910 RepID=UPI002F94DD3F